MKRQLVNFIEETKDADGNVVMNSSFALNPYRHPSYMTLSAWSAAARKEFQSTYTRISEQFGKVRKMPAATDEAMTLFVNCVSEARDECTGQLLEHGDIYCALSLNYLLWLMTAERDSDAVTKRIDAVAKLLCLRANDAFSKEVSPPMTSWPVSRKIYDLVRGNCCVKSVPWTGVQGLFTAYACALAKKEGPKIEAEEEEETKGPNVQEHAKETVRSMLALLSPRSAMLAHKPSASWSGGWGRDIRLRTPVMPVATGLSRTLVMMSMPIQDAVHICLDMLERAWPVRTGTLSSDKSMVYLAQLAAGIMQTATYRGPDDALEKTCYVWTHYLW